MRAHLLLAAALLASTAASAPVTPAVVPGARVVAKPTIVLVHGAFADSSSWNPVVVRLVRDGYRVIAIANPLRGVANDAAYVASVVRSISGPVVLVGHSYGGEVISVAAADTPNVQSLVFVAGFAAEPGESAAALGQRFPTGTLGPTLAPPVPLSDGTSDLYIKQDRYARQFAADVPAADAIAMASTQRPIAAMALAEPVRAAAWRNLPSWFIWGAADHNIPAALQSFMAKRARARGTQEIAGASHVVMLSHPIEVTRMIERAAQ